MSDHIHTWTLMPDDSIHCECGQRRVGLEGRCKPSRPTAQERDPGYRAAMRDAGRGRLLP